MNDGALVLHGLLTADGRPAVWAETADRPAADTDLSSTLTVQPHDTGPDRATGRGQAAGHPYAMSGRELSGWLAAAGGELATSTLLLPSAAGAPLPSPERGVRAASRAVVRLTPWLVAVVLLEPGADLNELPECRWGASLRYLERLRGFAQELVDAGRVLPDLTLDPTGARARWRALITGPVVARLTALVAAMPPACRASNAVAGPEDLVQAALNGMVDALVRTRLERRGLRLNAQPPKSMPAAPAELGRLDKPVPRPGRDVVVTRETVLDWLGGLTGPSSALVGGAPAELDRLAAALDAWRASGLRQAPVRVCARLSSIDADEDAQDDSGSNGARWLLEFLMQPLAEPSVLVPAEQIWQGGASPLHRWLDHPQDQLLADLGRLSRIYPELEAGLRTARPSALVLDTPAAYSFLRQADLLVEAGFGVMLPARWQRPMELGLSLHVAQRDSVSVVLRDDAIGLDAIVDYRWRLALGDQQLTEAELAELARAQAPLVKLRGEWVYLDRVRLAEGLAFLRAGGSGQMTAGQALRLARLHPADSGLPAPVTSAGGEGWLGDLLAGRVDERLELLDAPAGLTTKLRPYQLRGLSWLSFLDRLDLGACLADDMGLGKTVQLLALESLNRERGPRPPTLLICPMSVLGNWQREARRFTPGLRLHVHHGSQRSDLPPAGTVDLVLTTYAVATRDVRDLAKVGWDRVVLDEAQHIKNSSSAAARAVRRLPARHRVALTGTPVENRLSELWSIMDFLHPGLLGSAVTFRARYAVPVERHADPDAAARLRRTVRPFLLRRVKADPQVISDLPDKIETRQLCNLTVEQATLYRAVVHEMLQRIAQTRGPERNGLVLSTMTKLKQLCDHPALLLKDGSVLAGRSGKLNRLEELLDGILAGGEKVLLFTQYAAFGRMLTPYLSARFATQALFLHGGTPKSGRDELVDRFQRDSAAKIFLLSLKAGGTGLNLTAANHVVHLDRWWNPATEAQATDRAFRIGQLRDVQVHTLVCLGTLEEKIDRMLVDKSALSRLAIGAGEGWLARLSTGELRDLVTLSEQAVDWAADGEPDGAWGGRLADAAQRDGAAPVSTIADRRPGGTDG